ncbi:zinc metalloproteinase nas-4-like [Uranotaenia lowii]|uniref:zinc metalloproteinase nas-4-like n=1 Tax=Uranotaenia lowii TaxID=190385 RepID=UPI0024783E39|nr:zinc metalloproteinase nas-4-like [Uranotaenia lowii]
MLQQVILLVPIIAMYQVSTISAQENPFGPDFPFQGPRPWWIYPPVQPGYPPGNLYLQPEEQGGYFEGDMVLSPEQYGEIYMGRNGIILQKYRWPYKIIPYVIVRSHFKKTAIAMILHAMRRIEKVSCVKFQPRKDQLDYVRIAADKPGCFSYVGRIGGMQNLNLSSGCIYIGIIMHEMIHALGFHHMQSASNRDQYVRILYENIMNGKENNFRKYDVNVISDFGTPYDYASIMHYDAKSFSKNGRKTIVPFKKVEIGQRRGISRIDMIKINKMYNC